MLQLFKHSIFKTDLANHSHSNLYFIIKYISVRFLAYIHHSQSEILMKNSLLIIKWSRSWMVFVWFCSGEAPNASSLRNPSPLHSYILVEGKWISFDRVQLNQKHARYYPERILPCPYFFSANIEKLLKNPLKTRENREKMNHWCLELENARTWTLHGRWKKPRKIRWL